MDKMVKRTLIIDESLRNDLFIIPTGSNHYMVYSPLRRKVFCINGIAEKYVRDFMLGKEVDFSNNRLDILYAHLSSLNAIHPNSPTDNKESYGKTLTIILSQICNMNCTYCYAQKSHSNTSISFEKIKIYIDYFYNKFDKGIERIVFIGGGEPMMTWPLLRDSILYIKKKDVDIPCSVITNGSILSDDQYCFFAKNNVRVIVSFDILPEIQNAQRPIRGANSHAIVSRNIDRLLNNESMCAGFRSTITELNVTKMKDMVLEVVRRYPVIKTLNLEPVAKHNISVTYYTDFINNFIAAQEVGKKYGINVYCSISLSLNYLKKRFCQREICLTPNGYIVSCHRNSSYSDEGFDYFTIGKVVDNHVYIADYESMAERKKWQTNCRNCFAKWHCAGGCVSTRLMLSEQENVERCSFIRELLSRLLYQNIEYPETS